MLRAHACVICGDPIPAGRRLDRRYCRVSCRSVAYRARKGGKRSASSTQLTDPTAASRDSHYGSIPREVLDILAKHFSVRDEVVRAELAAAQRRATQLQQALDEATAAAYLSTEESPAPLVAAQERIRKLTETLEQSQVESADKYDKLASKFETLSRQKQTAPDEPPKHTEELKTLRAELQAAQERLTPAREQADAQAKQLADLKRAVEAEKQRASQLDSQSTTWEKRVLELQEKCTAAEARARKDADTIKDQNAQLTELEAKLSEVEQHWQEDQTQGAARAREYEALEQRVSELQAQVETEDVPASEQLATLKTARDQLLAECKLHREHAEREAADSVYNQVSAKAIEMLRASVEAQNSIAAGAFYENMQRFGLLIDWSVRWFVRQYVRAVLQSESRVEVDSWVTKTVLALMKQSKQRRGDSPYGLSEWAEANPVLLCQIAGCVAASTTARITGATPTLFHTAMQSAAASYTIPELAASAPTSTALVFVPPHPAPALPQRRLRAQAEPAPVPFPVPVQSEPWPSSAPEPEPPAAAAPPTEAAPFRLDRLVSIKQDLLSVSHQLAEVQDIMGRPITGQRLRDGANITEQAQQEATVERWNYIHNPPHERQTPVFWVRHGALLDAQSERELTDRATERFLDLSSSLRILELKRRR